MPTPGIAANAYAQLARISDPGAGLSRTVGDGTGLSRTAGDGGPNLGPNFGELLKEAISGVGATGRKSDAQSQALVAGKANIVDVATAVAEAETAVSAMVAVRDSVISSYEEIMRMTI